MKHFRDFCRRTACRLDSVQAAGPGYCLGQVEGAAEWYTEGAAEGAAEGNNEGDNEGDTGVGTEVDTGLDTGVDNGVDTGVDTGVDIGLGYVGEMEGAGEAVQQTGEWKEETVDKSE